ncbi:hypothetical protein G6F40_016548 [Rhizopus arrhizus]|nr:hypothetical protein G6F40_016548 [Rhizopus arrhizus]
MGEHRIGILAGQRDAIIGRASLEDHRLALRRTLDVERPFHLEKAALVVEPTERVRREERATPAPPPGTRRQSGSAAHVRGVAARSCAPNLPAARSPHSSRRDRR